MFVERDITINGNWLDISDKAMFNRQYALLFFVVLNVSVFKVNECFSLLLFYVERRGFIFIFRILF